MEPRHPKLRDALKQAHPGLTDADIDRVEALIARRFEIDPEKDLEEIKRLDAERADLIRQKMPRYKEVTQAFRGQARPRPPRPPKGTGTVAEAALRAGLTSLSA